MLPASKVSDSSKRFEEEVDAHSGTNGQEARRWDGAFPRSLPAIGQKVSSSFQLARNQLTMSCP